MKKSILILAAILLTVGLSAQKEFITNERLEPIGEGESVTYRKVIDTIYFDQFDQYKLGIDTVKVIYHKVLNDEGAIGTGRGYIIIGYTERGAKIMERIYDDNFKRQNSAYNLQRFDWK